MHKSPLQELAQGQPEARPFGSLLIIYLYQPVNTAECFLFSSKSDACDMLYICFRCACISFLQFDAQVHGLDGVNMKVILSRFINIFL